MAAITKDDIWKGLSLFITAALFPLIGFIWNAHTSLTQIENDLGDVESKIALIEEKQKNYDNNAKEIIAIEKDIEYMKSTLQRIEQLVTK